MGMEKRFLAETMNEWTEFNLIEIEFLHTYMYFYDKNELDESEIRII